MQPSSSQALFPERIHGEPAWEIAHLFPPQGYWTEEEYLALSNNHRVEFCDGRIEVLPMPTELHQMILSFLNDEFKGFVTSRGLGLVLFSGLLVKLWEKRIREPDLVVLLKENERLRSRQYWRGADLAVEIVSNDDPSRDLKVKREEYAKAGIREYWIVDPRDSTIRVLTLPMPGEEYVEAGLYRRGDTAASVLLSGLTIDVEVVFSQPEPPAGSEESAD
jgi:Uma2 family endonuclease